MKIETICVHGGNEPAFEEPTGAVSTPIYQSATFKHRGVGKSTGFDYSRLQNPTRLALEKAVAELEGGADALAFSTGMAAIADLMELFSPGDEIVASADLYGGAIRYFNHVSAKNGVKARYTDTSDVAGVAALIGAKTRAVFVETPTNPMMIVSDISALAALAKNKGVLFVVDNTFLTPYFQRPLDLGADAVVYSGTKYMAGHNDTLSGFLVFKDAAVAEKARFVSKTVGANLAPFDSWLVLRGLKTLALRMERSQENAFKIARFLQKHKKIKSVLYVGLPEHPGHGILKKQASGFGSMITFTTDTSATALAILERVRLIAFAESLGGVETLITYPCLQTHADVPEAERIQRGIADNLLRLSVGVENADDLIEDLSRALK
jgi:cystathionine gamma-synthase